ncbi:mitochondrial cardiolipin hydrolase-like [Daktulosphaira vitifoliae]|uniref:mitochondrial cardiolipin hydrolase-like n=1 Tax=Daktulosphaira vitifoliae TaxID=58002 RepID=UPI0021AA2B70|nr:mitochondrial cardiolipin hydrolase-like [Daktulosphaira vitifoliae]
MFLKLNIPMSVKWTCLALTSAFVTVVILHYKRKKFNSKVLFFEPIGYRPNYSLCPQIMKIVNCLYSAQKSIDVCVYTISSEPLAEALVDAHKRGILVRIIVSNGILLNTKEVRLFRNSGIKTKYQIYDDGSKMHHKFAIVDSTQLIHGSMNWTHQAAFNNWESVLITNLPSIVNGFNEGFEKTWLTIS